MLVDLFTRKAYIITQIVSSILLAAIATSVMVGVKNSSAKYVEGSLTIFCSIIAAITSWGIILMSREIKIIRKDNNNYARINGKYELLNEELFDTSGSPLLCKELALEIASLGKNNLSLSNKIGNLSGENGRLVGIIANLGDKIEYLSNELLEAESRNNDLIISNMEMKN